MPIHRTYPQSECQADPVFLIQSRQWVCVNIDNYEYDEAEEGLRVKPSAMAGPMRNTAMVAMLRLLRDHGHECVVLAFPIGESPGTRDCMRKAKAAGFTVFVTSGTP